jgi:hypothetical protein
MADVNLGQLASTTLDNYMDTMVDNIFKNNVVLNHFKENGGVELKDGGNQIQKPLMYAVNSSVQAFSGTDGLDITYQGGIDAATYQWRMYNASVVLTKEDELKNSGKSQIIDLLKAKIMQAENSLSERINDDFFNGVAASKEIDGLDTAIGTGTYGGIAGGTYTWWNSYVESTGAGLSVAQIRVGMNTVNNGMGGSKCSLMVTTQLLHQKYESLLTATITNISTSTAEMKRLGDAGFLALGFRGVPVVLDQAATSGVFYFLNTKNLKLTIHKDANFTVVKKAEPIDQHLSVQHIMAMLQLTVDRRASLGKLTAKTTA